jgi:hypothetical protein
LDNKGNEKFTSVIKNNKIIFKSNVINTKYIKKAQQALNRNRNFITMDLETRTVNGVMEVIMLTAFDGKDLFTF